MDNNKKFITNVFLGLAEKLEQRTIKEMQDILYSPGFEPLRIEKWFLGCYKHIDRWDNNPDTAFKDLSMGIQLSGEDHLVLYFHHKMKKVSFKKLKTPTANKKGEQAPSVEHSFTTYDMEGHGAAVEYRKALPPRKERIYVIGQKEPEPLPLEEEIEAAFQCEEEMLNFENSLVKEIDSYLRLALAPGSIQMIMQMGDEA